jgi:hypothetical protein
MEIKQNHGAKKQFEITCAKLKQIQIFIASHPEQTPLGATTIL